MKSKLIFTALWLPLMLCSCNQPEADGNLAKVAGTLSDTATASSAPLNDTTLLPIAEVTLRALGNTLEEIKYDQDTLEVKAGAHVKLTFVNEGTDMPMVHNVVFTTPGNVEPVALAAAEVGASGNYVPASSAVLAASPMALPGQTVEMEFTSPTKKGNYGFVCTYPEHWNKMHGVLVVK
ncbi:plastocyanin/azurin family copper-binding protein [Pontibacter rugosus]|uniref:Plastocyanin/azurin family copper-binding protein n=1 Tax=Pontibacter rugosus TaxID=1745966 RepID=A0ABW3SQG7_9BACT